MAEATYSELLELVAAMRVELAALRAENEALKSRVADLETQLRTNSRNSSKPPSSDGPAKPAPKSLRRPTGRKPGGQAGHEGTTLTQVPDPDIVIRHDPSHCKGCGTDLAGAPQSGCSVRQVFDLPPIRVQVTEHRVITRTCACGVATTGTAPPLASHPVQYGPVLRAVMVYLFMGQHLSQGRTARAVSELFNVPVSSGTVATVTTRAATDLAEFTRQVTARLATQDVVNFDETSLRCAGRLAWLHSASTTHYSLIFAHPRRGRHAMDAMGVLPAFTGTAVHDAWAPYDTYTKATHALCGAHLLRELQAVIDHHATTTKAGGWCWADQVASAFLALNTATQLTGAPLDPETSTTHVMRIRHALACAEHPTGKTGKKHQALARRISKRLDDYLRFTHDPAVPFTNNAAEQNIRMAKIRQKISGTMRTLTGAQNFATIRSYIQTTNRHALHTLDALTRLTSGNPWLPDYT